MDIRTLNDASKTSFKNNVYYGTTTFGALGSTTTTNYDSSEFNNTWNPVLVNLGLATKIQIAHPLGKAIVDGYQKRDKLVVLFG